MKEVDTFDIKDFKVRFKTLEELSAPDISELKPFTETLISEAFDSKTFNKDFLPPIIDKNSASRVFKSKKEEINL